MVITILTSFLTALLTTCLITRENIFILKALFFCWRSENKFEVYQYEVKLHEIRKRLKWFGFSTEWNDLVKGDRITVTVKKTR